MRSAVQVWPAWSLDAVRLILLAKHFYVIIEHMMWYSQSAAPNDLLAATVVSVTAASCQWIGICITAFFFLFVLARQPPPLQWARASSFTRFLDHTQRCTTVGRTPLDEWSALRIDVYLTTHNTHSRQTSLPPVGFETTISAGERP
jgi:hypothetical protein